MTIDEMKQAAEVAKAVYALTEAQKSIIAKPLIVELAKALPTRWVETTN